ncbi:hypothetical protein BDR07DRAFT_1483327 [Suillus spraguei]|nr:hypothetical protein BDR07DRAFT_1483327 [Suillus spraguei]
MLSPKADSSRKLPRDIESDGAAEKMDSYGPNTILQTFLAFISPATPEHMSVSTSPQFILSNPDLRPALLYVHIDVAEHEDDLQPSSWPWLTVQSTSLAVSTDELRLTMADGLLDPRLHDSMEGRSNSSLQYFEDYLQPIGGLINNQMHSTTTFATLDTQDSDNRTSIQN